MVGRLASGRHVTGARQLNRQALSSRLRRAALLARASLQDHPLVHTRLSPETSSKTVYFGRLLDQVADVPGDVVECGVGRGTSLTTLAGLLVAAGSDRQIWGFDSFEGFPDPSNEDTGFRRPRKGQWAVSTPDEISRLLVWNGIPSLWCDQHLHLLKGFFSPTAFAPLADNPIALLHLDVDLYESYTICLRELYPRVSPGGVIAFDEYQDTSERWPGAVTAIDEFLAESHEQIRQDPLGKWYLVKKAT